jgi:uncharacterized repeat protein (TIGR03803 family)
MKRRRAVMKSRLQHKEWISVLCAPLRSAALLVAVMLLPLIVANQVAQAQTFTVFHAFGCSPNDGGGPLATLIQDAAGNFYSTTVGGGTNNEGTVYKLSRTGKETVLYSFHRAGPASPVVRDAAGNLYGFTQFGGVYAAGAVFKLNKTGKETLLYSFTGGADGSSPHGDLARDKAGNLYGSTVYGGGTGCGGSGCGTVFELDPSGKEKVLYSFTGTSDGGVVWSGVTRDNAGNLYGTTYQGGSSGGNGTVFKVSKAGKESVLHRFAGGADGAAPAGPVVRDSAGSLYGATTSGGSSGLGTVFKVDKTGKETVLYSFAGGTDGANPYETGLVRDATGNLYGTTLYGGGSGCGGSGCGTVFELDPSGKETVLYSFTGGTDGYAPWVGLYRDKAGTLYGTASSGGTSSCGTVFKLIP